MDTTTTPTPAAGTAPSTTDAHRARVALPALFVSHGSPMIAIDPGATGRFLQALGPAVDAVWGRPRAIVAISAHSLQGSERPVLLGAERHAAVYDFGGFDPALYRLRYDAPGAPALADRAAELLQGAGMPAQRTADGGLDHGIWTVLRHAWPQADVPVLPLAWPPHWGPTRLHALGGALAPLAAEGVLVLGTGSITHNLRRALGGGRADRPPTAESTSFREWFADRAAAGDLPALFDYRTQAPHAVLMHPTDEHLLPVFVAAGAGGAPALRLHAGTTLGDLGMDAYAFGTGAPRLRDALSAARAV